MSIFDYLADQLERFRIHTRRRNDADVYREMNQDVNYTKELDGFYSMLQRFLSLHKNGLYSLADIEQRLKSKDVYSQHRNDLFLKIYQRIYCAYEKKLQYTRSYDFADMINTAKDSVDGIKDCAVGYRYILLDEVQDLSRNRAALIRSILHKNPGCKLFAVGDDWQSIYRFAGSDLSLIQNFERTFGLTTRRSFIESTHRFGESTIKISCDFIQRNPAQSRKLVKNIKNTKTTIGIILNKPRRQSSGQDAESLRIILRKLIVEYGYAKIKQKSLQLISRYNHDIRRIESDYFKIEKRNDNSDIYDVTWRGELGSNQSLKLEFCSIHKSKGITRDIVIVLNMNSDLMGMPATRESDPILDAMLAKEDNFPFAEERRLFYVAITRAREATYLIANRKNPSPYIFEISDRIKTAYGKLCPKCHTGELIKKHGKHNDFLYCSNFAYGCNYLKKL